MQDLDEPRHGAPHGLAVAGVQVAAEAEVTIQRLGEVELAQIPQCFRKVVDHEAVMVRKVVVVHLGHFPAGQVEVQAVDEGHVVANHVGHRREQVAGLHHHVHWLLCVAEHRDAGIARGLLLPALVTT